MTTQMAVTGESPSLWIPCGTDDWKRMIAWSEPVFRPVDHIPQPAVQDVGELFAVVAVRLLHNSPGLERDKKRLEDERGARRDSSL